MMVTREPLHRGKSWESSVDNSLTNFSFKYFKASRQLMDITDCRDLPSLQAVVCMILFLQSSAKLSVCYSYIGIALHSAIRLGLHRSIKGNFDPIETEIRKRLFWQIRKMSIYVGAMLGLPISLSDDDIDQTLPEEIDDEYLTIDGPRPMPSGYTPLASAMNAHTRLVMILRKVTKYIYPIKGIHNTDRPQSYSVSHAKVREIERDLSAWMDELPDGLKPGSTTSEELQRLVEPKIHLTF
jgi:Fungal specific transcription factor domain